MLRDSACKRMPLELTAMWAGLADERKWRRDAGEALVRARLLSPPDLDAHLAKVLGTGRPGGGALDFAVHLVRACCVAEPLLAASELFNTLETLLKLSRTTPQGAQLQAIADQARRPR
jgi:hypothetical protein